MWPWWDVGCKLLKSAECMECGAWSVEYQISSGDTWPVGPGPGVGWPIGRCPMQLPGPRFPDTIRGRISILSMAFSIPHTRFRSIVSRNPLRNHSQLFFPFLPVCLPPDSADTSKLHSKTQDCHYLCLVPVTKLSN